MSYDIKYRKRAIEYLREGHTYKQTSEIFGISTSILYKWENIGIEPVTKKKKSYVYKSQKIDPKELDMYMKSNSDAYQSEIAKHFKCTQQAVSYALKKLGYTRTKRHCVILNKIL